MHGVNASDKIILSCEWEGEGVHLEKEESKIYLIFESSINRYSVSIPKQSSDRTRPLKISVEKCDKETGKLTGESPCILKVATRQIQRIIIWSDLFKEIKISSSPKLEGDQQYLLVFSRDVELRANLIKKPNDLDDFFKLLEFSIALKLIVFEGKFCGELVKNNIFEILEPTQNAEYEKNLIKAAIKKINASTLRNAMLKIRELQQNPNESESICEICKQTMTAKRFFDMVYFMLKDQVSNQTAAKAEVQKVLKELSEQFTNECMAIKDFA